MNNIREGKDHSDARVPDDIGACTSRRNEQVQPLDVTFNAEFKKSVDRLATEHLNANPECFMMGKVTAGDLI